MKPKSVGSIGVYIYVMDEKRDLKSLKCLISLVCHLLTQNKNQSNMQRQKDWD